MEIPQKDLVPVQATMETETKWKSGATGSTAQFFRDEKGRTRVEQENLTSIHDPVAGQSFLLDPKKKLAFPGAPKPPEMPSLKLPGVPKFPGISAPGAPPEMKETGDLGEKTIQGIKVSGKQFSVPVPGKPQPLTHEVWTAPDLKLPMHSTFTDPSTGTTTITQMKNVAPGAKLDPGMFKVPADFKIASPPAIPGQK